MGTRYESARRDQGFERSHLSGTSPQDWVGANARRRKEGGLRKHGDRQRGRSFLARWSARHLGGRTNGVSASDGKRIAADESRRSALGERDHTVGEDRYLCAAWQDRLGV